MFYRMDFDMEIIDESIREGTNAIYAEQDNLSEIEYDGIKKGFFDNIILSDRKIDSWPEVKFYYSSKVSNRENEYLLSSTSWPIIHKKVQDIFERERIQGIEYYSIELVDVCTDEINDNYVLMYVKNFIDAYDMEKSRYSYEPKYNFYSFEPHATYLSAKVCEAYDIFRCKQDVTSLYVSEKIKKIIDENQWKGFDLVRQRVSEI